MALVRILFGRRSRRSRPGRLLPLFALVCAGALPQHVCAQTNGESPPPANRWLLIVDTSKAMRPRARAAEEIASMLVYSGMNGQARPGDTVGLWTFDETLHAGKFPLFEWKPEANKIAARHVFEFLGQQEFQATSRLEVVLPQVQRLIKDSAYITFFLISDGREDIQGTPFDDKINATYRTWRREQEKAQMPFVTMLRAKQGRITDYVVDMPPWPLKLPPLPTELEPAKVAPAKPQKAPPPVVPSLIISGRKSEPAPATPPSESPATNAPPSTPPPTGDGSPNAMAPPLGSASAAAQADVIGASSPHAEAALPRAAGPVAVATALAAPADASAARVEQEAVQRSSASEPSESRTPKNEIAVAVPEARTAPAVAPANRAGASTEESASPAPVQTALTLPQEAFFDRKSTWILASLLVVVTCAAAFFVVRRSRAGPGASLITRSLDREQK